jgi:hypothetical protein
VPEDEAAQSKESLLSDQRPTMLAKLTAKNQVTLPKSVTQAVSAVRAKLAKLELVEKDLEDAVRWARRSTVSKSRK